MRQSPDRARRAPPADRVPGSAPRSVSSRTPGRGPRASRGAPRRTQRGVTFLGWLILLIPVAIVVYAGIRLTPMYLNYMRVARSLERLSEQNPDAQSITADALRQSLDKSFDIETIEFPTTKDIDIHRDGEGWVAIADYQDVAPLFGDLSLMVQFHKEVDLP